MSEAAILSSNNFSYAIKEPAKKANLELLFNGVKYSRTAADSILGRMGWTIEEERIPRTSGLLIRVTRVYHNGVLCSR